jgi:hypothetical protein
MATAVEELATPPASELMTIESNPASHEAVFTLHAPGALLSFEIYSASGRLLARIHPDSGRIRWTPDGAVRRGVYFARAVTAESSQVVKFVIVR